MTALSARVEITGIAAGGDGVARTEGMVVFTPRTAPGDVALVRLTASKRFARGKLESIEHASTERVDPPCVHYTEDRCGGCQLQHLSYEAQLRAKASIISDSIRRIGRRDVGQIHVEASDAEWRYRRKLTLHVRRVGTSWIAGLHPYDDSVSVFDLRDCPITDARILEIWSELRTGFDHLPPERALRVSVRLLNGGGAVVVEGGKSWADSARLFELVPSMFELWWKPEGGRARRLHGRDGSSHSGASFVQINARVAERLHAHVLARVRAHDPARIIDAYAGSGATAIPLARIAAVVAIELDAQAVEELRRELPPPSVAIAGRVEDHLSSALPADVVLLNPPRTGVDAKVAAALQQASVVPKAIIYVSCDPATLARDLSRLSRYRLAGVRAYDMFPQTAHVETVCELVPEAA